MFKAALEEESPRQASSLLVAEMLFWLVVSINISPRWSSILTRSLPRRVGIAHTKHSRAGLRLRARNKESDCSYHR